MPLDNQQKKYTYADYLKWPEDQRWELIEGVPWAMTPAPSTEHQLVVGELFRQLSNYFMGKNCLVFIAPFEVRLPQGEEKDEEIETVVQPDIAVICDRSKIDTRGCRGVPDFIIEVVSPNTASRDYIQKLALYERNGVKEYWIVHPLDKIAMVYRLTKNGQYGRPEIYSEEHSVPVSIFQDLAVDLKTVFSLAKL
ncbi:MAG: Uma2 family endonuclease [Moorellaceae bacterium]